MAPCWRCRTEAPSDANFCANCGAEIKAQARDLPVFAAPTTVGGEHVEAAEPAPSRWLLLVAVLLLGGLIGFFAVIGGDDEPSADPVDGPDDERGEQGDTTEPEGDADTETVEPDEATIGEIVAPLEWETTFAEGVGFPMAALTVDDSDFVYSVDSTLWWSGRGTAQAYRRTSEGTWEALGVVIDPDAQVGGIWEGPNGALATGLDAAGNPTLWRTTDGVTWAAESLPVIDDEFGGAIPRIAAEAGGVTMVVGAPHDPWMAVQEMLRELYPDDWQGLSAEFNSSVITVRGPFGIVVGEHEITDSGFDPERFDAHWWERPLPTWYTSEDGWTIDTVTTPPRHVFTSGDRLFGLSDSGLGPQLRVFDQGEWGEPVGFRGVWHVEPWGDQFVGTNQAQGISIFDDAGELIERVDLPGSSANGHVSVATTSDAGLVVAENNWASNETSGRSQRVVALRDGYTLEVDSDLAYLTIRRDNEVVFQSSNLPGANTSRYAIDDADSELSVTFLSKEGDPMVAFTIGELIELEQISYGSSSTNDRMRVMFTADLESWYVGDVALDPGQWFIAPRLTDDRIIATQLVGTQSPWAAMPEGQRFSIIEASLPE